MEYLIGSVKHVVFNPLLVKTKNEIFPSLNPRYKVVFASIIDFTPCVERVFETLSDFGPNVLNINLHHLFSEVPT